MVLRALQVGMVVAGIVAAVACANERRLPSGAQGGTDAAGASPGELSATLGAAHRVTVGAGELVFSAASSPSRALARLTSPSLTGAGTKASEPRELRSGLFEIERGWATERIEQTPSGVEQTWRFEARPQVGSVQIRIPVAEATPLGRGKAGLVFRFADGKYLTYGDGTWIDARGERTGVPARFVRGAIELTVPEAVLASSRFPAVLDPVIGVENTMTADKLVAAENRQGYTGRIALGTSSRLMAWSDAREGIVDGVYFTLVDASSGNAPFADAAGRRLGYASLTGLAVTPAIAFAGGQYLVTWASYRTLSWARIDETGKVLDSPAKTVTLPAGNITDASVAANGSSFMVTFVDQESGNGDLRALRIDSTGAALDAEPIAVVSDTFKQAAPSIHASSDGYWIVFHDDELGDDDVRLVRLLANGSVVDAPPLKVVETFADQSFADLALDATGQNGIVVWHDSATLAVHGAAVSPGPASSLTFGTPARISVGSGERAPRVINNGSSYQVAWISAQNGDPAPQVARLSSNSPVRADGVELGVGWSSFVDIAARGSQTDALWDSQNTQTRSYDIFRSAGTTSNSWGGANYLVSRAATTQLAPKMANDSSRFFIGWETPRVGGKAIEAVRVNPLGEFEDASPIQVSSTTNDQRLAGVYSNDTDFLVVWHQKELNPKSNMLSWRVMARLVSDDGTPAPVSEEFRMFSGISADPVDVWIDYASFPWRYVFTFIDGDVIYNASVINGRRGASKFLYESNSVISARALRATSSYVYYLTTDGYINRITNTSDILGGVGGPFIELPGDTSSFDVTGNNVLALYNSQAGTVSIAGAGWTRTLATGLTSAANPQIDNIPGGFLVAWNEGGGIVGSRVTSNGDVMDAQPATLSQEPALEQLGDLFVDFADRGMLTYSRPIWTPGIGATRVATRAVDFRFNDGKVLGQACVTGFDCKSGLCADGVCCDTACGYSKADCQVCSKVLGASADGTCTTQAAGSTCRASAGVCDPAETCDGSSTACPAEAFAPSSAACGQPADGDCDKADHCPGNGADCVTEGVQPSGTPCRASRGPCDKTDVCDGETKVCPDELFGVDHVCRPSSDACDEPDTCPGNADDCTADAVKSADTVCRPVADTCDVEEACDGSLKACPTDAFLDSNTVCREADGDCDVEETCTGDAPACPIDAFAATGTACRAADGDCDSAETCTGNAATCPTDTVTTCGGTSGASGGGAGGSDSSGAGSTAGGAATSGTAGSPSVGTGGTTPSNAPASSDSDSGCSCRTAGGSSLTTPWSALALVVALLRRRRSRPSAPPVAGRERLRLS